MSIFKRGSINDNELEEYIKQTSYQPTKEEFEQLLRELKADRESKGLDSKDHQVDDFVDLLYKKMDDTDIDYEFIEAFKIFDKNGTGSIPISEFKNTIINDKLEDTFNEQQIEELLKLADIKNDGLIHYEKFVNKILNKKEK